MISFLGVGGQKMGLTKDLLGFCRAQGVFRGGSNFNKEGYEIVRCMEVEVARAHRRVGGKGEESARNRS